MSWPPDLSDPEGGEPLRDLLGLLGQDRTRKEIADNKGQLQQIADGLSRAERARKTEAERIAQLPRCPHCGGRLEGQYSVCMHCRNPLSWVKGYACVPGQEQK